MNLLTIENLTWAGGELLWRASWQGGLALAAVWAATRIFRSLPPPLVIWLWRLAYLKFLVCLLWSAPLELPILAGARLPPTGQQSAVTTTALSLEQRDDAPASLTLSRSVPAELIAKGSWGWPWLAALVWLLGALSVAGGYCRQWFRLRAWRRGAGAVSDPGWSSTLEQLTVQFGLRRVPQLQESSEISSPLLCGIIRPTILLPRNFPAQPQERSVVLAHELGHLRARDLWWNWLVVSCDVLFFFHPVVWVARRRWRLAQEIAADAFATRQLQIAPADYGRNLLELKCNAGWLGVPRLMAATVVDSPETLKERLTAMKHFRSYSSRSMMAAALIICAGGALALVPWRLTAQSAQSAPLAEPPAAPSPAPKPAEVLTPEIPAVPAPPATPVDSRRPVASTPPTLSDRDLRRLSQEDELSVLRADLSVRRLELEKAQDLIKRMDQLVKQHVVDDRGLYDARLEMSRAEANLIRAQAEIRAAERRPQMAQTRIEIAEAQAELAQTRALDAVRRLPQRGGGGLSAAEPAADIALDEGRRDQLRKLFDREIQLTRRQVELVKRQVEAGNASQETLLRAQADLLRVRQQAARLEGRNELLQKLFDEQIQQLRIVEESARKRYKNGTGSEEELLAVQLEILALERQRLVRQEAR